MTTKQLLTTEQMAEVLQVSPRTIYTMRSTQKIPFIKIGDCVRFDGTQVLHALGVQGD